MRNALIRTVVVAGTLLAAPALGTTGTDVRCGAVKIRAIGKGFAAKSSCHANAVLRGSSAEAPCLTRAQQDLAEAFARAESRGGCAGGVSAASLGIALDAWVAGAVATLAPPTLPPLGPPTEASLRCALSRVRAVSRTFVGKLRCRAAGVLRGSPSEASCAARAQATLVTAFARTDAHGGCTPGADAATLGTVIDTWVASAVTAAGFPVATPAPTPTPTPTAPPVPTGSPTPPPSDVWACCEVSHPQLGSCNGGVTGPAGSPLAEAFRSFCEGQGGTWRPERCTVARCGAAAACCSVGSSAVGTSEYFGAPDPAAIAELCAINGGSVVAGACPAP